MRNINELLKSIEELRNQLNDMVSARDSILDDEIVEISIRLDKQLVEYYKILESKTKGKIEY